MRQATHFDPIDALMSFSSLSYRIFFLYFFFFFFNDTATTEIYTLSLHDALPISRRCSLCGPGAADRLRANHQPRSEEHTSELQSRGHLVCRLLLEKKKTTLKI